MIKTIIATVVVAAMGLLYGEAVESILIYGGLLSSVVVVMLTVFPERWDNCIKQMPVLGVYVLLALSQGDKPSHIQYIESLYFAIVCTNFKINPYLIALLSLSLILSPLAIINQGVIMCISLYCFTQTILEKYPKNQYVYHTYLSTIACVYACCYLLPNYMQIRATIICTSAIFLSHTYELYNYGQRHEPLPTESQ